MLAPASSNLGFFPAQWNSFNERGRVLPFKTAYHLTTGSPPRKWSWSSSGREGTSILISHFLNECSSHWAKDVHVLRASDPYEQQGLPNSYTHNRYLSMGTVISIQCFSNIIYVFVCFQQLQISSQVLTHWLQTRTTWQQTDQNKFCNQLQVGSWRATWGSRATALSCCIKGDLWRARLHSCTLGAFWESYNQGLRETEGDGHTYFLQLISFKH